MNKHLVRPLEIKANLAWWNANTSGKDEDFKLKEKAQNQIAMREKLTQMGAVLKAI